MNVMIYRDDNRETDIASTISMPHLHLAHNASRQEAPHPAPGTTGCGTPGAGTTGCPLAENEDEAPDPDPDLLGPCTARGAPGFIGALTR